MEPIEQHAAPSGIVIAAIIFGWAVGDYLADWFGLKGAIGWVVIGVVVVVVYVAIGATYGAWYTWRYNRRGRGGVGTAPAARPALEHVRVMEQAVEQRGDGGGVAEELSPVVDRPVRGEQRRRPLVAAHDQLEQVFGGGVR